MAGSYEVTGAIATGTAAQPSLEPFAAQQRRALADAFISSANALELADGLGTKLDAAYETIATCASPDDGATSHCTITLASVARLIAYTYGETSADAGLESTSLGTPRW